MTADCLYCPDIEDNAKHAFLNCDRRAMRRASLVADIITIALDNIVRAMLRGKDVSNRVAYYAKGTLRVKKGDLERR